MKLKSSSTVKSCDFILFTLNKDNVTHVYHQHTVFEMRRGGVHASKNSFSTADRDTRARAHTRLRSCAFVMLNL